MYGAVNSSAGVALGGPDPVSYHAGSPAGGEAGHSATVEGVEWHFTSAENRASFLAEPARYAPQFGASAPSR